ncbi:unnamed protein product [Linum tenue]|uniref:Secreted protein n=1 Tax=Linum tenue TaxID=586396 RepID=A0AAV0KKK9_9ROSI|nr:unnamed protein product [Linum tenue]
MSKNFSHLLILSSLFPIRTLSYTNGNPAQECFPLSGPNIGCVHRTSNSTGKYFSIMVLANSFTESTSTKRVLRFNL